MSSGTKELLEHPGALIFQDTGDHLHPVIEPRIVADPEQAPRTSGLEILCAVDKPRDASVDERTGTHRAWFECHVERRPIDTPTAHRAASLTKREDFSVPGRICLRLAGVTANADDATVEHDDRTYGYVSATRCDACERKALTHVGDVVDHVAILRGAARRHKSARDGSAKVRDLSRTTQGFLRSFSDAPALAGPLAWPLAPGSVIVEDASTLAG